jgi:N4-(beta-N-acetylglucosaminyl)-L-asparaginase
VPHAAGGGTAPAPVPPPGPLNHDTIALLVLGADGNIAGGCSTSGLGGKLPGRVGDSPILGSGLYVDNEVGAAGATGVGENVMRYCGSFMVVENMRLGMTPEEACVETIRRIARMDPRGFDLEISFVALDKTGRYGGAGTPGSFEYAATTSDFSVVLKGLHVASAK